MFKFTLAFLLLASQLVGQDVGSPTYRLTDSPLVSEMPSGQSPESSDKGKAEEHKNPTEQAEKNKKQEALQKKAAGAYKPLFFDNDFSYLNDPAYSGWNLGDRFKQIGSPDGLLLDLGGQYRMRYQGERNMRGLGLTGNDDDFLLYRTRLFANARFGDRLRVYSEFIDAESNYENFASRIIDVNRADFLNLFVDLTLPEFPEGELTARVGRQELLYGNQRLISPLDWANTRRTFEGVKLIWSTENWNTDLFYTRPVIIFPHQFDSPNYDQEFMGIYGTRKSNPDSVIDLFTFRYNNGAQGQDFRYTTSGARWLLKENDWAFETEGGVQFGKTTQQTDHSAGYAMAGLGHTWSKARWTPTLTAYYDWASGGNLLGGRRGFDHAFPLAHKYLGFIDLFGRSNINTPNMLLTMKPTKKTQFLVWYYYFFLADLKDTPYNINMTPFHPEHAPTSRDLGHELDLLLTYSLTEREEITLGYSHFVSGSYYDFLPSHGPADFFYAQYQVNF